jgi:hypothetical protein
MKVTDCIFDDIPEIRWLVEEVWVARDVIDPPQLVIGYERVSKKFEMGR